MRSCRKERKNPSWPVLLALLVGVAFPLLAVAGKPVMGLNRHRCPELRPAARDLVFLESSPGAAQIAASFAPHANLAEAKRAVMVDELRRLLANYPRRIDPARRDRLAELLVEEGNRTGLDPVFLAAVIRVESAFSPAAVSNKGARGLMQLMPATAAELASLLGMQWQGPERLHGLEMNVRLGTIYLKQLLQMYSGDVRFALTAYNRGPHNVSAIMRRHGRLQPRFTDYFRKINRTYRRYRRWLGRQRSSLLDLS